jgi:hypothetical protein
LGEEEIGMKFWQKLVLIVSRSMCGPLGAEILAAIRCEVGDKELARFLMAGVGWYYFPTNWEKISRERGYDLHACRERFLNSALRLMPPKKPTRRRRRTEKV